MNPIFIQSIADHADGLREAIIEDGLNELELFVRKFGQRVVSAIEEEAVFALNKYVEALETEKQRPPTPDTLTFIRALELAIDALQKFPGIMSISTDGMHVVIKYSDAELARKLNFGTREIPKLDPSRRAVAILIREASKQRITLKREHLIY